MSAAFVEFKQAMMIVSSDYPPYLFAGPTLLCIGLKKISKARRFDDQVFEISLRLHLFLDSHVA